MSTPLTFGIELEFLVPFKHNEERDPDSKDTRPLDSVPSLKSQNRNIKEGENVVLADTVIMDRILATLNKVGLPTAKMRPGESLPSEWHVVGEYSLYATHRMEKQYGEGRWIPVEVISPVLQADSNGFADTAIAASALISNHRLFAPPSCGFHVHVGNSDEGFSLPAIMNIAAFLWTFDHQLASLHPPHRRQSKYCTSMRLTANISKFGADLCKGIDAIYAASNQRSLVGLIHETDDKYPFRSDLVFSRYMAYNFSNLVVILGKKTIEFRQFCATSVARDVQTWAETCCGIVKVCMAADPEEFREFLKSAAKDEENKPEAVLTIGGLLREIGLPDQAAWADERAELLPSPQPNRGCNVQ